MRWSILVLLVGIGTFVLLSLATSNWRRILERLREDYEGLSIVGIILRRTQKSSFISGSMLLLALGIMVISAHLIGVEPDRFAMLILLILFFATMARTPLLELRIRLGLYGTNETEAIEIISFLVSISKDMDLGRPLVSEQDLAAIRDRATQPFGADMVAG
jgi:hypothetical protein